MRPLFVGFLPTGLSGSGLQCSPRSLPREDEIVFHRTLRHLRIHVNREDLRVCAERPTLALGLNLRNRLSSATSARAKVRASHRGTLFHLQSSEFPAARADRRRHAESPRRFLVESVPKNLGG